MFDPPQARQPRIIVFGNEKGGSGKSTTAMHLAVALLQEGLTIGSIDLDGRQGTFSRYVENRARFADQNGLPLATPRHQRVYRSNAETRSEQESEDQESLRRALAAMADCEVIVIDTPGSDSYLSRLGHTLADTLITPLNDSFIDLDLLAEIDPEARRVLGPSIYAQMVWEQRQRRARTGARPIDWVVMRNRLAHLDARNKRDVGRLLDILSQRIGFRVAPGFGERVIFRELFLKGLTLLDLKEEASEIPLSMSHVAARQEVRRLMAEIGLAEMADEVQAARSGT